MKAAGGGLEPEQLRQVAEGESRAFRRLYDAFAPKVYQYAVMRTGSAADAEEIVQETMLAVWNGRAELVSRGSIDAWIFRIARNKTADLLRRRRIRQAVPLDEALAGAVVDGEDPAGSVDAKEVLSQLGEEERDLILMVFLMDMTYEEAGEALGVPAGTVKSRMHHLRRKLRTKLEGRRSDAVV